jgi:hypothetical protein
VLLERHGVPATVVITEPFRGLAAEHAARAGAPGYHTLVVPHPIWSRSDAELQRFADGIADAAVRQLT